MNSDSEHRGPGRPRIGRVIQIVVPDDVADLLTELAARTGQPISAIGREVLADWAARTRLMRAHRQP